MNVLGFEELWDQLLTADETVEIEAKRAEKLSNRILETVSSFSNEPGRGGGYLLLGVGLKTDALFPDYEVVGVPNPDQLQADLATKCREMLNIIVRPSIDVETHHGKNVVVAYIPEAQPSDKPVYLKSKGLPRGAFRRIGSTDQHCTDDDIALFYQLRDHKTYDETHVSDTTLEDLDPEAIDEYRRLRAKVNPDAPELEYSDEDLLYSLNAIGREGGRSCTTIAGLMLFGRRMALRRHFPMIRVDYIRVEGREWVPDPERRYKAVEISGPLVTLIQRVVAQVLDDIPKAFSLPEDDIHRNDVPAVPRTVIREAVVNALMHRNYRMRQPVQVIRYANRLEIRNPGHSLVPDDRLGEPGSLTRNEKIAAVLHEVGLAETKGTGIRAMREAMERANLTRPVFESDRERDTFTVMLLVHHLLDRRDVEWLGQFKDCNLSEDEARALIVVREFDAINNAVYRDINHMDTLTASGHLRRLRDLRLLDQRGRGPATYYVPTPRLTGEIAGAGPSMLEAVPEITSDNREVAMGSNPIARAEAMGLAPIPEGLAAAIQRLGGKATPEDVHGVIRQLCAWRPLKPKHLAGLLGRNQTYLVSKYLRPMTRAGDLEYLYPDNPAHPRQAYRTPHVGGTEDADAS